MRKKKVAVIGAGAAGLMTACAAAQAGAQAVVLERNEKAGKKIYITGKGRCNLTNACEPEEFLRHVVSNPRFLYSALYGFDQYAMMDFLSQNGCPVKTERGARVFPVSDHASDVTKALTECLKRNGGSIRYHSRVREILTSQADDGLQKAVGVKLESGEEIAADAVVLCTGGLSYPSTGSTGDGYRMAKALGLPVKAQEPSLVPLVCEEEWCRRLQGLALKNVQVRLYAPQEEQTGQKTKKASKRPLYEGFGELLFTHFGLSGPLILTASCKCSWEGKNRDRAYRLFIDLKPAIPLKELEDRIAKEFAAAGGKHFPAALRPLFPARLAQEVSLMAGLGEDRTAASVSGNEIRSLAALIKEIPVTITGTRGFQEAVVTRGGIDVKSFDPHTMECRLIHGLYAAGEVLDLDAHTGGFNLQIAWSTGHLAGVSCSGER